MDDERLQQLKERLATALGARLELGELLGVGGFAAVFRARDPLLNRDVAIKALDPKLVLDDAAADRLLDEARLVATAEHPHIVPLYEAGHRDGVVYLVMRYFPDGTVAARLSREGPLTPAAVAQLGVEVADALSAAHARGVLHLDIKPENLLLDGEGHAFVGDFGISRVAAAADALPDGMSSGTPHYMSPEQVAGDRLDGRADVYALGVVLYEVATGRRPITGNSAVNIMANQVSKAPEPLSTVAPELPRALSDIITRALAKNPDDRWGSAKDMADALRMASAADKLLSPKLARRRTRRRWVNRTAMVIGGVISGMFLFGYLAYQIWMGFRTGVPPAIDAFAPAIPAAVLDSARTLAALTERDTVVYVFAPNGHGMKDALVVTPEDLVVVGGGTPRRYAHSDYVLVVARTNRRGLIILRLPNDARDTVYHSITGLEQQILELGMRRALPE
jgi:tRNA A-37 threonylcarbamoyl transferase component Bud32